MTAHFSKGLDRRHSTLVAAFAGMSAAVLVAALLATAVRWRTFMVWCREFLLANLGGYGASKLALVLGSAALGAVVTIMAVWYVVRELRFSASLAGRLHGRGRFSSGKAAAAAAEAGVRDAVLVDDPDIYAFTKGFLRPRVFISRGLASLLTRNELRAVMRHEGFHARRRHPLQATIAGFFERCLFFVPSFKDIARHLAVAREVHADRSAGDRHAIASALARIAAAPPRFEADGVAMFSRMGERIRLLAAADDSVEIRFGVARLAVSTVTVAVIVAAAMSAASVARAQRLEPAYGFSCPAPEEVRSTCIDLSPFLKLNVEGPMSRAVQSPYIDAFTK